MKKTLIFFLFLVCHCLVSAQYSHPPVIKDSNAIEEIRNITKMAKTWTIINIDSSLAYARLGLQKALELNDHIGMQANLILLGDGFAQMKEYNEALAVYEQVTLLTETEDYSISILLNNGKGLVYAAQGKYPEAIEQYQQATALAVANKDKAAESGILVHLGRVYREQGLYPLALETQQKALAIKKSYDLTYMLPDCLEELGLIYEAMGQLDKAIDYFDQSLTIERSRGNQKKAAEILNKLAASYQKERNPIHSIGMAEKALAIAKENNDFEGAAIACTNLSQCYRMLKDFKQSLSYQKLSTNFKDQLFKTERQRLVYALKANFELSKKELENHLLKEKEVLLQNDLRRKKWTIFFFCLALIFASALAVLFYRFNKVRSENNSLLQEQNKEINEQKQELEVLLEKLKSTQSQLIQSEKMASLGQLTAGIAHEINNPVNFIYAGIAGLKKNLNALMQIVKKYDSIENSADFVKISPEIKQFKERMGYNEILRDINGLMQSINDGAERTGSIVKSLKTFSRIESKALNIVNVHQNLDSTLTMLNFQLKGHIKIKRNYAKEVSTIESFNGELNQVFMNILTNAIQAIGKEQGLITITTEDLKEKVTITIADSGIGMSESAKEHLFEPFYTTKEVGEGTGLGLSITYGIIKKHRGVIEVESELGKGTIMIITLPKKQGSLLQDNLA